VHFFQQRNHQTSHTSVHDLFLLLSVSVDL
jgi:hypothetical protein